MQVQSNVGLLASSLSLHCFLLHSSHCLLNLHDLLKHISRRAVLR